MYFLLKIISKIFQIIPRRIALYIGRMFGTFFYYFVPIRKTIANKNLDIAFPKWSTKQKKAVLYSCYKHYGMVLIDFFRLPKIKKYNDKNIVQIPKQSLDLFKNNNGGIIMSGHIGNWEYIGPYLGINGINCAGVAKVQRNSKSNQFFNELRGSNNVKIISMDAGSDEMIKTINIGHYLGLISDQNAGKKGTDAPFFGHSVSVAKGAGAFHLKTNTPILLGFCILSTDYKYELCFNQLDVNGLSKNSNEAIKEINKRYTKLLEQMVTLYPHQYFWFHRKWPKVHYLQKPNNS